MNTADMIIHVHPEFGVQEKTRVAKWLESRVGVDCAEFSHHPHSHALMVKYDPAAIKAMDLLQMVRKFDPVAMMVGL